MERSVRSTQRFVRTCGSALIFGGLLAAGLNAVLTPMLPTEGGTVELATSTAFGIRMPLAATSVFLVTLGLVGLYLAQADRTRYGGLVFLLAGVGGFLTFWIEVVQVTLVRDLAFAAPEALVAAEEAGALARYDLTFAVGFALFALGWLGVAALTLKSGALPRRGAVTFLAGALLVPLLGGLLGIWGAVVGNVVLGGGWALLGVDLRRAATGS